MNKSDIAYLRCIRTILSFKTNALWFIVLFIFIYENSNNKDKQIKLLLTKLRFWIIASSITLLTLPI